MLPERRRQYLEAIGIDLWVRRGAAPVASAALSTEEVTARWQALLDEVRRCTRCPLHATRTQGVLGVGPKRADWMVIGEAPGAEEDRRGEPFVGAAGQLLDAMLRAIGLDRKTNVAVDFSLFSAEGEGLFAGYGMEHEGLHAHLPDIYEVVPEQ